MIYINEPTAKYYKYDDVVALAIKSGIEAKRAFIYLAGLGVKGLQGRVFFSGDYSEPMKIAVFDKNKIVTNVSICGKCKGLVIK